MFFSLLSTQATAARQITVTVNGRTLAMDVSPVIRDGRTLVPLRVISDALGAEVLWNASKRTVVAIKGDRVLHLAIGNTDILINGIREIIDVPPQIINGRTLVPLRVIGTAFRASVNWDTGTRTVSVISAESGSVQLPVIHQPQPVTLPPVPQRQRLSSGEVTARVMPAVVRIDTHRSQGSGFFVSPDGLVLTNAHVVRGSGQIVVVTHAGERFSATITKIANWHDLALLRVNAPSHIRFPFLSDNPAAGDIRQGEEVLAFGTPLGLTATVTRGIISAWRETDVTFGAWANNNIRVLQHDAAIAPGNSGGPLVNLYGEWVGVNTLVRLDWAGFGFAVPAERYHALLRQGTYSLRCDFDSYRTENWHWDREIERANQLIREFNATPSTQVVAGIRLLSEGISIMQALRRIAAAYQPLSPEVQDLHRLYLIWLDAWITNITFLRNGLINPVVWSRSTSDMLINNRLHAWDAYITAWNTLSVQFR
jgi:hypothetical protein